MNVKLVFTTSGTERVNLTKSTSKCCLSNQGLIRITSLWNHSHCLCYTEYSQVPCSCLVLLMCCKLLFVFVLFSVCGIIHFEVLSTSTIWLKPVKYFHIPSAKFVGISLVYLGSSCHIYVTGLRYLCHVDFCHLSMTFPATAANSWCLRTWPRSLVALPGAIVM